MKIGDKLYRALSKGDIVEHTVTSVGRKYLYLDNSSRYPVDKDTLMYVSANYSQMNRQYYKTKEEIELIYEYSDLLSGIRNALGAYGNPKIPIEKLRAINAIINPQTH